MASDQQESKKQFKDQIEDIKKAAPPPKVYVKDVDQKKYTGQDSKNDRYKIENPVQVSKYDKQVKNEEELESDDPAHLMVEKIRDGVTKPEDLIPDDKFVIIRYLRETERLTQDKIAEELSLSRRTVINYCNKIKKLNAQKVSDTTAHELGGELLQMGKEAMKMAIQDRKGKDWAYIAQNLVTMLQSLGLIYKQPSQSQIHQMMEKVDSAQGYKDANRKFTEHDKQNLDSVIEEVISDFTEDNIIEMEKEIQEENKNGNSEQSDST